MILIFQLAEEMVIVKAQGNNILFSNSMTHFTQFVPIEVVRLNVTGILKQFPDLKDLPESEIRRTAIKRFKEHIKNLDSEMKVKNYLIEEFEKMGYVLKSVQMEGFRPTKR